MVSVTAAPPYSFRTLVLPVEDTSSSSQVLRQFIPLLLFNKSAPKPTPVHVNLPDPMLETCQPTDALYVHQLSNRRLASPLSIQSLTPSSFLAARITSSPQVAIQIHRALLRCGVLNKHSLAPVTRKIGRKFAAQVGVLPVAQAKELARILIFWDTECQRLWGLDAQERDLKCVLETLEHFGNSEHPTDQAMVSEVQALLLRCRLRKELRPSERTEDGKKPQICLPAYEP